MQTLSEEERGQIAAQDPKVREMIERAEQATPEEMIALHGRLEPGHPQSGEPEATVGREDDQARARGSSCGHARRGATPTTRSSPGAGRRSSGSTSTTTTSVHLGVTVDDDPGQELMRDTGRYLFFKPEEVELDGRR